MSNIRPIVMYADGTKKELPDTDSLLVSSMYFNSISGDLASPIDGNYWYNSLTGKFRCKEGGTVKDAVGTGSGVSVNDSIAYAIALG